jgi:hypothetical protein
MLIGSCLGHLCILRGQATDKRQVLVHGTDLNRIEVGLLGELERASLLQLKMKGTPMAHEVIRIMTADEAMLGELRN